MNLDQAISCAKRWHQSLTYVQNNSLSDMKGVCGTSAAAPSGSAKLGDIDWIVDTGSQYDLIQKSDLNSAAQTKLRPSDKTPTLNTAGGLSRPDKTLDVHLPELSGDGSANPLLMKSCPPVLSLGYRCQEEGYTFHWPAYSDTPSLIAPNGEELDIYTDSYIPYLRTSRGVATPAASSSSGDKNSEGSVPSSDPGEAAPRGAPEADTPDVMPPPAIVGDVAARERKQRRDLKAEATSLRHFMTHLPKNPHCKACQRSKLVSKASPSRGGGQDTMTPNNLVTLLPLITWTLSLRTIKVSRVRSLG